MTDVLTFLKNGVRRKQGMGHEKAASLMRTGVFTPFNGRGRGCKEFRLRRYRRNLLFIDSADGSQAHEISGIRDRSPRKGLAHQQASPPHVDQEISEDRREPHGASPMR